MKNHHSLTGNTMELLINIFKLLRPSQWIKNLFVFAPIFFTFDYSVEKFFLVGCGFVLFCAAASAVYIFNDYCDREEDRQHPEKKSRPLASGSISVPFAFSIMVFLLVIVISGSVLLSHQFLYIVIIYICVNLLYTFKLKHTPIIDIVIIASGFVFRIFAGSAIIHVDTSLWIVLITFLLALFLALGKRRGEYQLFLNGKNIRKNISGYNIEFINSAMVIMAAVTIVAYIMYTISSEVINRIGSDKLYITTFFVIIGILRYLQIMFVEETGGDPTKIILKDTFLQITVFSWIISFLLVHSL